jgi:Kef-type K+ transport system membrane component KefB
MKKNILLYLCILSLVGAGVFLILQAGARLYQPHGGFDQAAASPPPPADAARTTPEKFSPVRVLAERLHDPLSLLLLQVFTILITAKLVGGLFRRLGQPAVVGEMLAGILLGPSVLGMLSPGFMASLFPSASMESLRLLSQVGVILFMFVVGTGLNLKHLRQTAHAAILISHLSIALPFISGAALSLLAFGSLAGGHVPFYAFALFVGIAMSITAFPVLARIISERGLTGSPLGNTALACAAVDDVTAWCLLTVIVAVVKAGGSGGALVTIVLTLFYIGFMFFLLRPQVTRQLDVFAKSGAPLDRGAASAVLLLAVASALLTELIGIHALFGAFLAGVILSGHGELLSPLTKQLEMFTTSFLLPLYFVFTGLRTQVGLIDDWPGWLMCGVVVLVAIAGKLGGGALAARSVGISWRESLSIGALLNTRGLIELIVLNIGYDLGVLSPRFFSMMVMMAVITTMMAGPILSLLSSWRRTEAVLKPEPLGASALAADVPEQVEP